MSILQSTCLAGLLVCCLCNYIFVVSSASIRPDTSLIAARMAKSKWYSLAVPHLALLYKGFGEYRVIHKKVKRTYWSVVIRWLRCIPSGAREINVGDTLLPLLHDFKGESDDPSKLFWYRNQVSIRRY